jgi:hypothetical protein
VRQFLVKANVVPSSPILVTLVMEVQSSCETLVLTRATRHNITEDAIRLPKAEHRCQRHDRGDICPRLADTPNAVQAITKL